jgi:hypothetical protein
MRLPADIRVPVAYGRVVIIVYYNVLDSVGEDEWIVRGNGLVHLLAKYRVSWGEHPGDFFYK